jgi:hypothetical protein
MDGVQVILYDAAGQEFTAETNCAGNFFFRHEEARPTLPVWVSLGFGGEFVDMRSVISREISCAACHAEPAGPNQVGRVYYFDDEELVPEDSTCE